MADQQPSKFAVEPTDPFMNIALPIMRRWEAGTLSSEGALEELAALRALPATQAEPTDLAQLEQMASTVYATMNKFNEGIAADRIAIRLFREVGNIRLALISELNIAVVYKMRGDTVNALAMYRNVLDEAREKNIPSMQAYALQYMSVIYVEQERWDEIRIALEEAEPLLLAAPSDSTDVQVNICQMYRDLTTAYIHLERWGQAWETAARLAIYAAKQIDLTAHGYAEHTTANALAALEKSGQMDAIIHDQALNRNPDAHYQKAVETFLKKSEEVAAAVTLCDWAQYLGSRKQYQNGAGKAAQAARLYKKLGMEREQTSAIALRAKIMTHS
jgi:tetratricopeptide (TPR) repeat protein